MVDSDGSGWQEVGVYATVVVGVVKVIVGTGLLSVSGLSVGVVLGFMS